jgi:hypothetical protein
LGREFAEISVLAGWLAGWLSIFLTFGPLRALLCVAVLPQPSPTSWDQLQLVAIFSLSARAVKHSTLQLYKGASARVIGHGHPPEPANVVW